MSKKLNEKFLKMIAGANSIVFATSKVLASRSSVVGYFEYEGDIIISARQINFEAKRELFFLN